MSNFPTVELLPDATPVNPAMLSIPWDEATQALLFVAIVAAIVERSLSLVYETSWFIRYQEALDAQGKSNKKAGIALGVSTLVAYLYQLDVMAVITSQPAISGIGVLLTGSLIAGGSKACVALFRDFLNIKSSARKLYESGEAQPHRTASAREQVSTPSSSAGSPVTIPD